MEFILNLNLLHSASLFWKKGLLIDTFSPVKEKNFLSVGEVSYVGDKQFLIKKNCPFREIMT